MKEHLKNISYTVTSGKDILETNYLEHQDLQKNFIIKKSKWYVWAIGTDVDFDTPVSYVVFECENETQARNKLEKMEIK